MSEQPHMKPINRFQTNYLKLLRRVKGSKPEKVLERTNSGALTLLEKFSDEDGIREAIGKLWVQAMGTFEKEVPKNPKLCANQMRELANASAKFLIDKFGKESGSLIKEIYKTAISQFILFVRDKKLGMRINKRIATEGAQHVRTIEQEDIAKEILKMPFMKLKPKGGMF